MDLLRLVCAWLFPLRSAWGSTSLRWPLDGDTGQRSSVPTGCSQTPALTTKSLLVVLTPERETARQSRGCSGEGPCLHQSNGQGRCC